MRLRTAVAIAAVGVTAGGMSIMTLALFGASIAQQESQGATTCSTDDANTAAGHITVDLTADQQANARTIIRTGTGLHVPQRGLVVAVATALQESTLHNLTGGDRDSVGLFQQRAGWGTYAQRHDPAAAAGMFYTGGHQGQPGLLDITGWQTMPVTGAAQAVQRSAFPLAYAQWQDDATTIVQQATAGDAPAVPAMAPAGQDCQGDAVPVAFTGTCKGGDLTGYRNGRLPAAALCPLPFAPGHRLRADAAAALIRLDAAYQAQFGHAVCVTDSYRDYAAQLDVFARKPGLAAVPGTSNHGWGVAVDLCDGVQRYDTDQYAWMKADAPRFGWHHPAWAEPGGSKQEPWHWEFTR